MKIARFLSTAIYTVKNFWLLRKDPVIVYAPGRVGSMGLIKNLRKAGVFSFKVEFFNGKTSGSTKFVKKYILNSERHANFITLVRDPVDIMASYFFDKCAKGWLQNGKGALQSGDMITLNRLFIDVVLKTSRLDQHLYWFEEDFFENLGISALNIPFDHSQKIGQVSTDRFRILIIRTELDDTKKSDHINIFLGTNNVTITRYNQGKDKEYATTYKNFKEQLKIPGELIEKIYTAPYVTHFFSEEEIRSLKTKWS